MYVLTDNTRLNRSGFPVITSVRADSAWVLEGSQSGWINVSGTTSDNIGSLVSYTYSHPDPSNDHQYESGPYAYTPSGNVVPFYDNVDVFSFYNVRKFGEVHAKLVSSWTPAQMAGWDTKEALLRQYQAMDDATKSGAVNLPAFSMLKYEAQERGVTMDYLISGLIQPLADYYAMKHGQLYGRQKSLEAQIVAVAGTDAEIKSSLEAIAIDYSDIL